MSAPLNALLANSGSRARRAVFGSLITWKVIERGAALAYAIELRGAKAVQGRFKPGSRAAKQVYHGAGLLHSGERLFDWAEALARYFNTTKLPKARRDDVTDMGDVSSAPHYWNDVLSRSASSSFANPALYRASSLSVEGASLKAAAKRYAISVLERLSLKL